MKGKLTIEANIPENEFMEGLLNMRSSGLDVMLQLSFYALAHTWHYKKFNYYIKLLDKTSSLSPITNYSPQEPLLHSHREKLKGRKVSEKVVASRIGENRFPDEDTNNKEVKSK